jgi:hypothetical protein
VARHAAGHWVDREPHLDAAPHQDVGELADLVLRLSRGGTEARNDDDQAGRVEQEGRLLWARGPHRQLLRPSGRLLAAEAAEQDVRERPVHRPAHDDRQQETT